MATEGAPGGTGGAVTVHNSGDISSFGDFSQGLEAQSLGGGGGAGGSSGFLFVSVGGSGGKGGHGGAVDIDLDGAGTITTGGMFAQGVLAQSIGGGGGAGGSAAGKGTALSVAVGGAGGGGGRGGDVRIEATGNDDPLLIGAPPLETFLNNDIALEGFEIATQGNHASGMLAQSVGGGGGVGGNAKSDSVSVLASINVAVGGSGGEGAWGGLLARVASDFDVLTVGPNAYGIAAQSIGGGGGFNGDPSLNLGLLVSNTVENVCCGDFSTGADGGEIVIEMKSDMTYTGGVFASPPRSSIVTDGKNAHGIVAQSIGGGGTAAGWANDPTAFVYMGNPRAPEWNAPDLPADVQWTGQGGDIRIDIDFGSSVTVQGDGAVAIIAQSSGNKEYQRRIEINVDGTVYAGGTSTNEAGNDNAACEGCLDSAAILISGGSSVSNQHQDVAPNTVTIAGRNRTDPSLVGLDQLPGRVKVADLQHAAIRSIYGLTNVTNYGTIYGGVVLGLGPSDPNLGELFNYGTWTAGSYNLVAQNSIHNSGTIEITVPTLIDGSLKQYPQGTLAITLDPTVNAVTPALTVSGAAVLQGTITLRADALLPGNYQTIAAGSLDWNTEIEGGAFFKWSRTASADGILDLTPEADFLSAAAALNGNAGSFLNYLQQGWLNADPALAALFGYLTTVYSAQEFGSLLGDLSSPGLLQNDLAVHEALPSMLGDALDCPSRGQGQVILGESSCVWLGGAQLGALLAQWGAERGY